MDKIFNVEYMCSFCGMRITKKMNMGKPMPGKCSRRKGDMPHRWIVNRKY